MIMDAQLNLLDRSTLVVWRATNLIGWAALGALIGIEAHWGVVQLRGFSSTAGFYRGGAFEPELGLGSTLSMLMARATVSLFAAYTIGMLVGRRTARWQTLMAAFAALAYVLTALVGLEHSRAGAALIFGLGDRELHWAVPNPLWRMLLHDGVIALTVPLAAWVAMRVVRERAGLRGVA
jgi:hypothetical protein